MSEYIKQILPKRRLESLIKSRFRIKIGNSTVEEKETRNNVKIENVDEIAKNVILILLKANLINIQHNIILFTCSVSALFKNYFFKINRKKLNNKTREC